MAILRVPVLVQVVPVQKGQNCNTEPPHHWDFGMLICIWDWLVAILWVPVQVQVVPVQEGQNCNNAPPHHLDFGIFLGCSYAFGIG